MPPSINEQEIPDKRSSSSPLSDPLWYKDAVIYELRVRSFNDSNNDGIGDFPGLTQKLDYLHDLGVTALWILPFYPSPGRDDGYDIADYTEVNADYGRIEDFKEFLEAAHARGMKVITELVINHTSDQHPWFQRARRSPAGSSLRDFYVWTEDPALYKDARIIFKDFEPSNWSWDPLAKAYYWHRFFSHQPDLNFRNPEVQRAVFEVCDFWLDMGVDGMRLDAIPYLYEEDGTNCENLPETHVFLKSLRAHIDGKYQDRMLLAEANQWPEDAAAYFGSGDECNMNFHFPIMPRIFMSIHMEDRLPIIDILAQTPPIPENCQWALFLRNHDELTLEMVTDEERDYMYQAFANDPAMRINLGIRRRLAPLLQNDRPNIELMNALLFSLPGTPVIYYGDELGMGDNVYLGDRNGVRTPMQWSSDRNAGFSRANPQRLVLPVIIDPEYHYESINVEAQQSNTHSLLWWMKRLVALRKRYRVFGRGTIEFLQPDNPRVLAFLRQLDDQLVLVVANLSRSVQFAELDLAKYKGLLPVELFGGAKLPPIGDAPYLVTLGGHAFYWFALERTAVTAQIVRAANYLPSALSYEGPLAGIFTPAQRQLLASVMPNYLQAQHWFRGRSRSIRSVEVLELDVLPAELVLVGLEVRYADGPAERYFLFLTSKSDEALQVVRNRSPWAVVATMRGPGGVEVGLIDLIADPLSGRDLLLFMDRAKSIRNRAGELTVKEVSSVPAPLELLEPRLPRHQHQTAAVVYGDQLILKLQRWSEEGLPPDIEMTGFLTGRTPAAPTVPLVRTLVYEPRRGAPRAVAALQGYFAHDGDAFGLVTGELARFFERVLTRPKDDVLPQAVDALFAHLGQAEPTALISETIGVFLQTARLLGQRVAELHLALTSSADVPDFAPEPYSVLDQRSAYQSMRNTTGNVLRLIRRQQATLPDRLRPLAQQALDRSAEIYATFQPLLGHRLTALRSRVHGDLDLHHLIFNGKDFAVIDFDGDRHRPLAERRRKRSPLRDVGSLLTSLYRAAFSSLNDDAVVRPPDRDRALPWAQLWLTWIGGAVLGRYEQVASGAPYLPRETGELRLLLQSFLLEQALAELGDELERSSRGSSLPLLSASVEAPIRLTLRLLNTAQVSSPPSA